jgi:hypothetical protein
MRTINMQIIDDIRAQYPSPSALDIRRDQPGGYCVGDAIIAYVAAYRGEKIAMQGFPEKHDIADALMSMNSALPRPQAMEFAEDIIDANDAGEFEAAWGHAAQAVSWLPNLPHGGKL